MCPFDCAAGRRWLRTAVVTLADALCGHAGDHYQDETGNLGVCRALMQHNEAEQRTDGRLHTHQGPEGGRGHPA